MSLIYSSNVSLPLVFAALWKYEVIETRYQYHLRTLSAMYRNRMTFGML